MKSSRHPRRVALSALLLISACQQQAPQPEEPTPREVAEPQLSADQDLSGVPMPSFEASERVCASDDDCRAWRPSTWEVRVECCYEYGCALDWSAMHADDWAIMRRWRQDNAFDCASALADERPCDPSPPGCSIQLDATAECRAGRCEIALPPAGPTFTDQARSCRVDSDCVAVRRDAFSEAGRCCGHSCGPWTSLSRVAAEQAEEWAQSQADSCPDSLDCSGNDEERCSQPPPDVRCLAGLCRLEH